MRACAVVVALCATTMAGAADRDRPAAGLGIYQLQAGELTEQRVFSKAGEKLGEVERVVLDSNGKRPHVVVEIGGFLGLGGATVAIPLSVLQLASDALVLIRPIPGRDVVGTYPYREAAFRPIPSEQKIADATDATPEFSPWFTFERVDRDGDGIVTAEESRQDTDFRRNWRTLDQNRDGYVDQVEFAAFEQSWPKLVLSNAGR